jgi:hypothetical protein
MSSSVAPRLRSIAMPRCSPTRWRLRARCKGAAQAAHTSGRHPHARRQADPNVAAYSLYVGGVTIAAQRAQYKLEVDQNGHFEQQIPDGLYRITAKCIVNYAGHRVPVDLASLDGKAQGVDQSSDEGIVKDYRMVMGGLKPGEDPNGPTRYTAVWWRLVMARRTLRKNWRLAGRVASCG